MKFSEIVHQAVALLEADERVSYRALKREFELDDQTLEDLKEELIEARRIAVDEDGRVLVWAGGEARSARQPSSAAAPETLRRPAVVEPPIPAGERRQLTVMFCDLMGSSALSEQLDPEDLRDVLRTYQEVCRAVVERYEGYIAQYLGDGILAYFGYPVAHEEDATRAVQAGLDILGQLGNLELAQPLQTRIGIHTGPVVIGEVGDGQQTEQLALGETPNIAARVQGKAAADTLAISHDTFRLIEGRFACEELGAQDLKGFVAPVALYRVTGEGEALGRFDVSVQRGLTPFIGREEELELVLRRWDKCKDGDGQVVLLSGEAGIGKSRLVRTVREQTAQDDAISAILSEQCAVPHNPAGAARHAVRP